MVDKYCYFNDKTNILYILNSDSSRIERDMGKVMCEVLNEPLSENNIEDKFRNIYILKDKKDISDGVILYLLDKSGCINRKTLKNVEIVNLDYNKDKKEYVIPVSWMVSCTVSVKGYNALDAVQFAVDNIDSLPADGSEAEYIDGTYLIDGQDETPDASGHDLYLYLQDLGYYEDERIYP